MTERISSSLTFFYKFVFTSVWFIGFGLGTIATCISPVNESHDKTLVFGVAWVLGSVFIYWTCARLKRVDISDSNIIVSNYFKMETIPGSYIDSITQDRIINIRPITIRLTKDTVFGQKIMFIPKYSFRLFSEDPVVEKLRKLRVKT